MSEDKDVTLAKDEGVHGISLDLLRPTTRAWMKQVEYLPQALLDNFFVKLHSLLPDAGIPDKLLYCGHVDYWAVCYSVPKVRNTLLVVVGNIYRHTLYEVRARLRMLGNCCCTATGSCSATTGSCC